MLKSNDQYCGLAILSSEILEDSGIHEISFNILSNQIIRKLWCHKAMSTGRDLHLLIMSKYLAGVFVCLVGWFMGKIKISSKPEKMEIELLKTWDLSKKSQF
jgi:hypothetical protein